MCLANHNDRLLGRFCVTLQAICSININSIYGSALTVHFYNCTVSSHKKTMIMVLQQELQLADTKHMALPSLEYFEGQQN